MFPVACIIGKIYLHCIILLQVSFLLVLQREPLRTICRPLCRRGATLRKEVQKYLTIIVRTSPSTSTYVFCSPSGCFFFFFFSPQNGFDALFFQAASVFIPTAARQGEKQCKTAGKNIQLLLSAFISR